MTSSSHRRATVSDDVVQHRIDTAYAAVALAGGTVSPAAADLVRMVASETLTGDEAIAELGSQLLRAGRIGAGREGLVSTTTVVSPAAAARRRIVDESRHSLAMEGLPLSAESEADSAAFIAGEISADDMVARAQARVRARRG